MIDLTPLTRTLAGRAVAVFGLARSGRAAVAALRAAGADVWAWDDAPAARADVPGELLQDLARADFAGVACLVLSPGVHPSHPVSTAARAAGAEVVCDIELLGRALPPGRATIGITGTNGKSTVTALTAHLLRAAGVPVACGGNIGAPALGLDDPGPGGAVVLEVSSFQADLLDAWRPHAAALLNLAPDHIAHHGDFASYIAAKARLLQGPGLAVIGADDPESRAVAQTIRDRRVVPISGTGPVPGGVYATPAGALLDARGGEPVQIADLAPIKALTGAHNWQNAAAAAALALSVPGVEPSALAAGLATWPGLPHRQFRVREIGPVAYINDSKATNVDAAARALASFADIYWIAGGAARDCDLGPLAPHLGAVRRAFLIGASAPALSAFLSAHGVAHEVSGTLAAAVAAAHATAQGAAQGAGGTVVLAPSYQSFDQFTSFEDRGEQFCALVDRL